MQEKSHEVQTFAQSEALKRGKLSHNYLIIMAKLVKQPLAVIGNLWHFVGNGCGNRRGAALWHFVGKPWASIYMEWEGGKTPQDAPLCPVGQRNEREGRVAKPREVSCHGGDSHADLAHLRILPIAQRKLHAGRVTPAHWVSPR